MASPYQLEEREDAWVLSLGRPVTSLLIGMQLILRLDDPGHGSVSIRIENTFQLIEGCVVRELDPENPAMMGPVLVVIHKTIERAVAFKDGRLSIEFEDGRRIAVRPHPQYESWQIHGPASTNPMLLVGGIGHQLNVWDGQD